MTRARRAPAGGRPDEARTTLMRLQELPGGDDTSAEFEAGVLSLSGMREEAKALGHGINYGMGAPAMVKHAHKVGAESVTLDLAQEFLDTMDDKYPGLAVWKDEVRSQ